jgi:hypothetical protein
MNIKLEGMVRLMRRWMEEAFGSEMVGAPTLEVLRGIHRAYVGGINGFLEDHIDINECENRGIKYED